MSDAGAEGLARLESTLAVTRMHAERALRELHREMRRDLHRAERRAERAERRLEELKVELRRARRQARPPATGVPGVVAGLRRRLGALRSR